ncbi:hypothetical protein [Tepidiforma sp.]|uniref:Y-family DNA polymerase n=1 Tax=Tepidiforma sp. TaxID=2682230 RepID=UPI00262AC449|nr:hypothetical protein [Tepidiforma sp.]MCX7618279.1 hypothetical protein [Tepidiforma sp.]
MRVLVLVMPRLSVQLARREAPELRGRPAATVQLRGAGPVVAAASAEASAAGVEAGMALEAARGRCPALAAVPAKPAAELDELERLAAVLRAKATPHVAVATREAVAADLAGLEGRFADELAAAEALAGLARAWTGLDVRAAVADTWQEAEAAARAARRAVVCPARGETGALPRREGLAVRLAGPVTGERLTGALERLGLVLAAHDASCRGLEVAAAVAGGEVRRWQRRAAEPLHRGHELAALVRPLAPALEEAATLEVRVLGAGPSVEAAARRAGPALRERPAAAGAAARQLALAS